MALCTVFIFIGTVNVGIQYCWHLVSGMKPAKKKCNNYPLFESLLAKKFSRTVLHTLVGTAKNHAIPVSSCMPNLNSKKEGIKHKCRERRVEWYCCRIETYVKISRKPPIFRMTIVDSSKNINAQYLVDAAKIPK